MKSFFFAKIKPLFVRKSRSGQAALWICGGVAFGLCAFAYPVLAQASVESSLSAVQEKLVGTLLPLAAMCGLVVAGLSFVAGHPNARQHLIYAIVGAIVGFGSESIVAFIRNLIH